jgi:hypothetical protein
VQRRPGITSVRFKALLEKLPALSLKEVADVFGVSRPTVYHWKERGIPLGSKRAIVRFEQVASYIQEYGVQRFYEHRNRLKPKLFPGGYSKRCPVIEELNPKKKATRCNNFSMTPEGLCTEHSNRVEDGECFLLANGTIIGENASERSSIPTPKPCIAPALLGVPCRVLTYRKEQLCGAHVKEPRWID